VGIILIVCGFYTFSKGIDRDVRSIYITGWLIAAPGLFALRMVDWLNADFFD